MRKTSNDRASSRAEGVAIHSIGRQWIAASLSLPAVIVRMVA